MFDAITEVPAPVNEPVHSFAPGSPERSALEARLKQQAAERVELTMTIGGEQRLGGGEPIDVVQPHRKDAVLGTLSQRHPDDVRDAVEAARAAAPGWQRMSYDDRAAIFLKAADLLAGPWRHTLAAATMLGQSKTCYQAEIDTPCELVDFWRFNVYFGRRILAEQPMSSPGVWNRFDHRPLEGFVLAITPFNFTAIAGNLPTAPALMGNTVLWKPAPTQQLAAHYTMRLLEAAGLPPGVINMVTGDGRALSEVALVHPDLAGIHFTGSTATFGHLWRTVTENLLTYRTYPRLVGETGGKDFVIAHPSADVDVLRTALTRGTFEYQGQKCSAASRAYIPRSVWNQDARWPGRRGERPADGRCHRLLQLHGRGHRPAILRPAQRGAGPGARRIRRGRAGRRHRRRHRGLLRPPHRRAGRQPRARGLHHRVLRARSSACSSTTTPTTTG